MPPHKEAGQRTLWLWSPPYSAPWAAGQDSSFDQLLITASCPAETRSLNIDSGQPQRPAYGTAQAWDTVCSSSQQRSKQTALPDC